MGNIGIIDYGMGNLGSVINAFKFINLPTTVLTGPQGMAECDAVVLPGVGAFGDCIRHLREHGFIEALRDWLAADRPFLGICLGLQVLFEGSEESPGVEGLGVFPGVISRFARSADYKVPQIGWNRVRQRLSECPLFAGIPDESYFYFVHSYFADAENESFAAGVTEYTRPYASAIARGRLMAVQFHPEKSQAVGLRMLTNFGAWLAEQKGECAS